MKKNIAILIFSVAFVFSIASCGNSKHRPCPAYGSSMDIDGDEYLIACIDE